MRLAFWRSAKRTACSARTLRLCFGRERAKSPHRRGVAESGANFDGTVGKRVRQATQCAHLNRAVAGGEDSFSSLSAIPHDQDVVETIDGVARRGDLPDLGYSPILAHVLLAAERPLKHRKKAVRSGNYATRHWQRRTLFVARPLIMKERDPEASKEC